MVLLGAVWEEGESRGAWRRVGWSRRRAGRRVGDGSYMSASGRGGTLGDEGLHLSDRSRTGLTELDKPDHLPSMYLSPQHALNACRNRVRCTGKAGGA